MKKEEKEVYLFQFETQHRANYWMEQTFNKFRDDIVKVDKQHGVLEFEESIYYFWSYKRVGLRGNYKICNPEDLYIILDDPERTHLLTYEEDTDAKV